MALTMRDIGKRLGVSRSTVSRALSGSPLVNEKTRRMVLELAREVDFKPHALAQSLKLNKTATIGVLIPNILGSFYQEILDGVEKVVGDSYTLILSVSNYNPRKEATQLRVLREKRVDGVILVYTGGKTNYKYIRELQADGVPFVLVDRYIPDMETDYVVTDNVTGAREAVEYLVKLGHERIAYISCRRRNTVTVEREEGYRKALERNDVPVNEELTTRIERGPGMDNGYRAMMMLLERRRKPTAVFAVNSPTALGAMKALEEAGLRVPEDISVIGFDDSLIASFIGLTTVSQPTREIGEMAARRLLEKMERPSDEKARQIFLKPELVVRRSCTAPGTGMNSTNL